MAHPLACLWQALVLGALALCLQPQVANAISNNRRLKASAFCPAGCRPGYCIQAATGGGVQCQWCSNNLLVGVRDEAGLCMCVAGKYGVLDDCEDCSKGYWCSGGVYSGSGTPAMVKCPDQMTTTGIRATSIDACVNLPGYFYNQQTSADGTVSVSAEPCPADTYGPGLKKQRGCVPCPTGYTTAGKTAQTSPLACVVPAGYYLKAPGQVAPCPRGEWKVDLGIAANCTQCGAGVTTVKEASTSEADCKVLRVGWYARTLAADSSISLANPCPQSYLCPGGVPRSAFDPTQPSALSASEPTVRTCPDGMWTQDIGSFALSQCRTPPGFYTVNNVTKQCPDGSFRADWKSAGQATSCTPCGMGVLAEKSDRVLAFDMVTYQPYQIPVTTGSYDCYIQPGQGLYFESVANTWRAMNCDKNNYGTNNVTYGLTPMPCRDCPANMIANANDASSASKRFFMRNADGTGGFVFPEACITTPGYGYSGRVAQKCDKGTYNEGGNQAKCKPCPAGTTTLAPGVGRSEADCGTAPGYGPNGELCPIGTYNDQIRQDRTAQCFTCPLGTTTPASGSDSSADCQLCVAGYGGPGCSTVCGGVGLAASYGPAGRAAGSSCISCGTDGKTYGFSFDWQSSNDVFAPRTIARSGATSPIDCVSEYAQTVDMSFFMPLASSAATTVSSNVASFQACVDKCSASSTCQFATYDYQLKECTVRNGAEVIYVGEPWVGFKVLPSGYTGTNPWSTKDAQQAPQYTSAKALPSGLYTFWQDPNAADIGVQYAPANVANFKNVQDCLDACSDDSVCAGVTIDETVDQTKIATTCKLIKGDSSIGTFKRTVVRTDLNRIGLPVFYLCLGDRSSTNNLSGCSPITTLEQVSFVLKIRTKCDDAFIAAAKQQALSYWKAPSNPNQATPVFSLKGACVDAALLAELANGRKL